MAVSEKKYSQLLARMRREREQGQSMLMTAVESVETAGSASVHAMLDGYFGGVELVGVPLGVITGVMLHGLGALGLAPDHMHALGNGAWAQPICHLSRLYGEKMRDAGGAPATASGRLGSGRLSDADLLRMSMARG